MCTEKRSGPAKGECLVSGVNMFEQSGGFVKVSIVEEPVQEYRVDEVEKRWEVRSMQGGAFRVGLEDLTMAQEEALQARFVWELQEMRSKDGTVEERVKCMYVRGYKS